MLYCILVKKSFCSLVLFSFFCLSLFQRTMYTCLVLEEIIMRQNLFSISKLSRYDGLTKKLWWKKIHSARKIIKKSGTEGKKKEDIGNQKSHTKCLFLKIYSLVWWIPTVSDIKGWRGHLLFCTASGTDNRQTYPNVCLNPCPILRH